MAKHFKQGYYTPKNPDKYVGDVTKIRYMSSWELELHKFFDGNPNVIRWASEEIAIPYFLPLDGRMHKYYPDYWVEFRTSNGDIVQELIECKPKAQTRAPRNNGKQNLYEKATYVKNQCKWAAAEEWCRQRGIGWRIVTEDSIFK